MDTLEQAKDFLTDLSEDLEMILTTCCFSSIETEWTELREKRKKLLEIVQLLDAKIKSESPS